MRRSTSGEETKAYLEEALLKGQHLGDIDLENPVTNNTSGLGAVPYTPVQDALKQGSSGPGFREQDAGGFFFLHVSDADAVALRLAQLEGNQNRHSARKNIYQPDSPLISANPAGLVTQQAVKPCCERIATACHTMSDYKKAAIFGTTLLLSFLMIGLNAAGVFKGK